MSWSTAMIHKRVLLNDYDISKCIEDALNKFGPRVKQSVMWRMVVLGDSPKEGILSHPQDFANELESIFHHSADLIETLIFGNVSGNLKAQINRETSPGT